MSNRDQLAPNEHPAHALLTELESRMTELHAAMREAASSIDAHIYMSLADKLRDLEESVSELRRVL
jgi:hypothetical protein